MNFFSRLEKSLEDIIEGTILSRFRTRIQPIEIARTLWKEIRANQRLGVQGTYVPNFFLVTLSDSDYHFLEPIQENMEMEIIEHLETECRKRDFDILGPMVIRWMKDDGGREGEFFISSDFVSEEELPHDIKEKLSRREFTDGMASPAKKESAGSSDADTFVHPVKPSSSTITPEELFPRKTPPEYSDTIEMDLSKINRKIEDKISEKIGAPSSMGPNLTIIGGFDRDKRFIINKEEMTIGRDETCDMAINDPGVSRKHASILSKENRYYIQDLDSRSGLMVNGSKGKYHMLEDGDIIKMGITVIEFRT